MPLNQQESMQGTLKQCLLVDRPLMHYISSLSDGTCFDAPSVHVLCFMSQKPMQPICLQISALYAIFFIGLLVFVWLTRSVKPHYGIT